MTTSSSGRSIMRKPTFALLSALVVACSSSASTSSDSVSDDGSGGASGGGDSSGTSGGSTRGSNGSSGTSGGSASGSSGGTGGSSGSGGTSSGGTASSGGGSSSGSGTDGGSEASTGPCPASQPTFGEPCTPFDGGTCTYSFAPSSSGVVGGGGAFCTCQADGGAGVWSCLLAAGRRPEGFDAPERVASDDVIGTYLAAAAQLEAASVDAFRILRRELGCHGAPRRLLR